MLVVFRLESSFHGNSQPLSQHTFRSMVKENIRLCTLAAAVYVQKYGPAILINLTVLPVKGSLILVQRCCRRAT